MPGKSILSGIHILDLTRVWSGPMAGRMLAELGAEVILVEPPQGRGGDQAYYEALREDYQAGRPSPNFPDGDPGEQPWNRMGTFNDFNRNKLGITLDLRPGPGQELFKRLVKLSDVVMENFTPRVMENFGLTYPVLRGVNPAIIMVSMPGYGSTGPYRNYPAYGTTLEQHAGFSSIMGYPDSGPYRTQSSYPDPVAAVNAASAVMLALWHRRRTGRGQHIDLAQIEASVCLLGEYVLGYAMNHKPPVRYGNRHPSLAPHGCYRCKGDDRWAAIAVGTDQQWQAFAEAIGSPPWTQEERFRTLAGRWHNQDEMDHLIEEWTTRHDHYEVMFLLQGRGVAAGAALDAAEMLADPHLKETGFFVTVPHPCAGERQYPGHGLTFSRISFVPPTPAPCFGQDNEYVLGTLLGLPVEEIDRLRQEKVISDTPLL